MVLATIPTKRFENLKFVLRSGFWLYGTALTLTTYYKMPIVKRDGSKEISN